MPNKTDDFRFRWFGQLIAANLKMTDGQATQFWPVYDQYAAELSKIGDKRVALIKEYYEHFGDMTDEQALSLSKRALAVDEEVTQLRTKYAPILNIAVPASPSLVSSSSNRTLIFRWLLKSPWF